MKFGILKITLSRLKMCNLSLGLKNVDNIVHKEKNKEQNNCNKNNTAQHMHSSVTTGEIRQSHADTRILNAKGMDH
jgi:hypothetical protein